jgi:glycosyltransferase involved in cell wall biosynthesis
MITLPNIGGGGAETHFINLTQELRRRDVEVWVALLRPEGPLLERLKAVGEVVPLLPAGLVAWLHRLESVPVLRYLVRRKVVRIVVYLLGGAVGRLREVLREHRVDVVLSALWEADVITGWAVAGLPAAGRPQWVVAAAFEIEARLRRSVIGGFWLPPLRRVYERANAFVAPSSRIASQLASLIVSEARVPIWTIPNAVPVETLSAMAASAAAAAARGGDGAQNDALGLVAVGRLVPEKGFDVLLRALAQVRKRFPTANLTMIGQGPLGPYLRRLAKGLRLEDAVVWAGFLQNPFPLMARARLLVAPSRWETFGNAVAEAMALGVAVVATRCGGPEDLIESGVSGVLVPVDDVDALARAIVALLDDDRSRSAMAAAARRKAVHFSAGAVADRYLEGFSTLIG